MRIGFPTCWCAKSVPDPERRQADAAYHATWRSLTAAGPAGQPAARPADPAAPLADACAGWLTRGDTLFELAGRGSSSYLTELPDRDWRWGTATARQRLLHRLTVVAAVAADQPELTSLAGLCQLMRDQVLHRWPGTRPLPVARRNPLSD